MDSLPTSLRDLARRLIPNSPASPTAQLSQALGVVETLRVSLTKLTGADGYTALLRRALTLAKAELPSLHRVQLTADGRLEGLEAVAGDDGVAGYEAAVVITAHLLGLLVIFIGEPITLQLMRESWPGETLDQWTRDTQESKGGS